MALTVFGVGVTLVDFLGFFGHGDGEAGGHAGGGHGGGRIDDDQSGSGHSAEGHSAEGHSASGHISGHVASGHGMHHVSGSVSPQFAQGHGTADHGAAVARDTDDGSLLAATPLPTEAQQGGRAGGEVVSRLIGAMRSFVYFSLGAGPTGLVAAGMGLGALEGSLWAVGAGVAIAIAVRALRSFLRRDVDSSFVDSDFILEEAEITIPVAPGKMGKAYVARFGPQVEVYVKSIDENRAFARGERVRIVELRDGCCLVEPAGDDESTNKS